MPHSFILGTRASKMARTMAHGAKKMLEEAHPGLEVIVQEFLSDGCKTPGDLKLLGGKGAFVKDLEHRLLNKEIDCAIHCLKDVPGDEPMHPDLQLFCFLHREDPRDALIMRPGLAEPTKDQKAVLATSSPRRHALLKHLYPNAEIIPLRGNVDTRMQKLQNGEFDGMVLSYAGLGRLEMQQHVTKIYDPKEMLPAVGQGILVLQVRKEDVERCKHLRAINSDLTEKIVAAERALLMHLQGDCYSAIAGYCEETVDGFAMRGLVASHDGQTILMAEAAQDLSKPTVELGMVVAHQLLQQGAREIIDSHA
ncbi:MAG TPA: hydroxymethylbilane synthase [Alphaproteobacteria bacterium]